MRAPFKLGPLRAETDGFTWTFYFAAAPSSGQLNVIDANLPKLRRLIEKVERYNRNKPRRRP